MVMNKIMNSLSVKSDYLKIGVLFFSVLIGNVKVLLGRHYGSHVFFHFF